MPQYAVSAPPWLRHALTAQAGPVPWDAVLRGALACGPLLLAAVLADRPGAGVFAALGAMLAGVNDRPGSRRAAVTRLGAPALAGGLGLLLGTETAQQAPHAWQLSAVFVLCGLIGGTLSAVGPVASACGTQFLVTTAVGAGMPLPEPAGERALLFVAGAGLLLVLRIALPGRAARSGGPRRFDGERAAVAAVYDAVAALLEAVGTPAASTRRAALTAALDHAQDALSGPRLRRTASTAAERRVHAQYAAALPLAEAATALAWSRHAPLPGAAVGPRRLATAVRAAAPAGPLPAPSRGDAALCALDDALLHAADTFDKGTAQALHARRPAPSAVLRKAIGPAGREYGVRVAVCYGTATAVAQALDHTHWYWLPATAVFLVKPDLGPLASRVLCRALGTVVGAALFAGLAALLPQPAGLVAVAGACGALIPVAARHFAAQTAAVTALVLALAMLGGEPQMAWVRCGETLLACAVVLVVGHVPWPHESGGVTARLTAARAAIHVYVHHVLAEHDGRADRWTLRREAYRTLAEARAAIDRAAAELPPLARRTAGAERTAAALERLADATTACAVHLDDSGHIPAPQAAATCHEAQLLGLAGEFRPLPRPATTGSAAKEPLPARSSSRA
ncbi:FUSC family protein [Streptomyces cavernicola]|uniref:FUSC family protein n=1 Tax=Streptomyces cavernicola TaxID=3043613 RepID=A0ABT6S8L2_9ACTN|nr:FUSC family protein [Streptomyces sp. B-S-A6]MDI3403763.1 FUSC family protein [Streptomyces sp. B-S-A6]